MGIIASELKHRIAILKPSKTRGLAGDEIVTFNPFKTVFAGVKFLSSNEEEQSQKIVDKQKARFKIRFLNDLTNEYLIRFKGNDYNITSIQPFGTLLNDGLLIEAYKK